MTYIEKHFPIKKISELALKEGNSKRPVYQIHKWWARRLSSIVRGLIIGTSLNEKDTEEDFWKAFYSKNSLNEYTIMDIFMGGGSSLVEAKKMGAKTIGIDIDPMACFVTRKELEKVNLDELKKVYTRIENKLAKKIRNLYTTKVDGNIENVINYFWVYNVNCPECSENFNVHPHYKLYSTNKEQGIVCKSCGKVDIIDIKNKINSCKKCGVKTHIEESTFQRGKCTCPTCKNKFLLKDYIKGNRNLKLFAIEYEKNGKRFYKETTEDDNLNYKKINKEFKSIESNLKIPTTKISISNEKDKRPLTHGYKYYKELFNNRQLLSLGLILVEIEKIKNDNIKSWFLLAFSDSLASNNMLCSYAFGYRKLTPLFGIHAYTVPARPVENNVWGTGGLGRGSFEKTFNKMLKSKSYCNNPYEVTISNNKTKKVCTGEFIESIVTSNPEKFYNSQADSLILNQSSEKLDNIRNKSVNLILTDPPYYDNLHYSHLADFYYQWLDGLISSNNTNAIKNSLFAQNDLIDTYSVFKNRLTNIFKEANKKLTDNGMMVFSYHHNKENAWKAIGESLKDSGFVITKVFPIRSEGQSAYHSSSQTIKWDSIVIVRKIKYKILDISLNSLIKLWNKKIEIEKLELNNNDKLSFFRSLAIQVYTHTNYKIEELFAEIQ